MYIHIHIVYVVRNSAYWIVLYIIIILSLVYAYRWRVLHVTIFFPAHSICFALLLLQFFFLYTFFAHIFGVLCICISELASMPLALYVVYTNTIDKRTNASNAQKIKCMYTFAGSADYRTCTVHIRIWCNATMYDAHRRTNLTKHSREKQSADEYEKEKKSNNISRAYWMGLVGFYFGI